MNLYFFYSTKTTNMNHKKTGIINKITYDSDSDSFDDDVSIIRTKQIMGKFNDCKFDQSFQNNKNAEVNVTVTVNQTTKWFSKRNKKVDNECCEFKKVELLGKKNRFSKQHTNGFKPYCERNFKVITKLHKKKLHTNLSYFAKYLNGEGLCKLSKLIISIMKKRVYESNIDFPNEIANIGEYPINENINCFLGYLFELKIDEAELISVVLKQVMYGTVPNCKIQKLPNFIKQEMSDLEDEFHIFLTNNPDYEYVTM